MSLDGEESAASADAESLGAGSEVEGSVAVGSVAVGSSDGVVESLGALEVGVSLEGCVSVGVDGSLATGSEATGAVEPEVGALETGADEDGDPPVPTGSVVLRDGVVEVADDLSGEGTTRVGRTNAGGAVVTTDVVGVARCFAVDGAVVTAADDAAAALEAGASATDSPPSAATAAIAWSPST